MSVVGMVGIFQTKKGPKRGKHLICRERKKNQCEESRVKRVEAVPAEHCPL